ncbi:alginate export family protein [Belliella sp. DSM 111904]|uniref:Alginate export family protein n=1 Tax=Belliella filtrata TaxID=2923435 RepID=A0ABS9UZC5_9BACT|nr:alginate export family protein [Belliella filtrata]MCH7409516.1 alginate export family protein [Belliella filtrata]
MKQFITFILTMLLTISFFDLQAQFNIDGQFIQRSEYRNGFGGLISKDQTPTVFTAHRARLQATYQTENLKFYMSIQDIRTWGSTPQIKATDNFLSVHEAWGEINLTENWAIKLGRQELNYDNFRFLGNLDWALQARSHDFALVKYEKNLMKLHLGGAYNQAEQTLFEQPYLIPHQYKTAQMARYENKWGKFMFSALVWNDGRYWHEVDNLGNMLEEGIRYKTTIGIPTLKYPVGNTAFSGFYYHQVGQDITGTSVNAYNFNLNIKHSFANKNVVGRQWTISASAEHLSGTSNLTSSINNSYQPLYGTNHIFNGYMDLFYVGGRHENTVGLEDYAIKTRFTLNPKFFIQGDYHFFRAHSQVFYLRETSPPLLNRYLGSEIDFTFGWLINDALSIQSGYSQFFHSDTFAYMNGENMLKSSQNWAYIMLIVRPTMKNKFIGILL